MNHYPNPAGDHSSGWVLLPGTAGDDARTLPNPNAPPPTSEECKRFSAGLERVRRFYQEGEEKQLHSLEQINQAKRTYGVSRIRIEAQMTALEKYSEGNATRRRLMDQLGAEHKLLSDAIDGLDDEKKTIDLEFQKREDITNTVEYLQFLLDRHCSQYRDEKEGTQ